MLWTWLGPAVSGSVFPEVRSVGGQGWKVGAWDHLEFCPHLDMLTNALIFHISETYLDP